MTVAASHDSAIEISGLVKRFDGFTAIDHLDLTIRRGEMMSLLGPNGAGKSTTLRILTTLMQPTEGSVRVHGFDMSAESERIKPLLGLVPQDIALYDRFSPRRNLCFFGQLYGLTGADLQQRVARLLEDVELADRADHPVAELSGGMQRRVNIAAALVHDPEIVFFDEPTVGLDPASRMAIWRVIEALKSRGKTLVLTTHYMEEAEELSDRVAIVERGKVVAIGAPDELIRETGALTMVKVVVDGDAAAGREAAAALPEVSEAVAENDEIRVYASSGSRLLPQIIQSLLNAGLEVRTAEVTAPNLGTVYLHYTGQELRD